MKTITKRQYSDIVDDIIQDGKKRSAKTGKPFGGVVGDDLYRVVKQAVGDDFTVKEDESFKLSKADINAVANSRYYRSKGGFTLIVATFILVILLSIYQRATLMPPLIFFSLLAFVALGFIWIYSRGQSKIRKDVWAQLGREESEE